MKSMKQPSPKDQKDRKRKGKSAGVVKAKNIKIDKMPAEGDVQSKVKTPAVKDEQPTSNVKEPTLEELAERFPVLKNRELVEKFMKVTMTNNQKGRIRQVLKDSLSGTTNELLPDVIHDRIQSIIKVASPLHETDLRKLRILYNMLITAAKKTPIVKKVEKTEKTVKKDGKDVKEGKKEDEQKVKGPKRYVVFIGNLPLGIEKEKITNHFSMLGDRVKSIRIPKQPIGRKSAIAYLEVADKYSYELALSKHHSMLENKRINVLYTTQQKSKVSKTEAKSKSAKLIALQNSGKLIGSVPLNRKRSARRKKMKAAQKRAENDA